MQAEVLIKKIEQLPENLQLKAEEYIESLLQESKHELTDTAKSGRGYGSLKGLVTYISDDFDEPLTDFKDYQ